MLIKIFNEWKKLINKKNQSKELDISSTLY